MLLQNLEQRYSSKRDIISRIPLGIQPDTLWQELQTRRRSRSTILPLTNLMGIPYWYVTTEKMVVASEKIVDALFTNESNGDLHTDNLTVTTLEEVFYTSYVEGAQISIQAAMDFLTSERPPRDIEEQLIANNRMAGSVASSNLYRNIDTTLLQELSFILTDGMDNGGPNFRINDPLDYYSINQESFSFPQPQDIPAKVNEVTAFLNNPQIHPLIKSAVIQAWMLVVRPFPEGNERLGRILSNMVLLRAGYTFFSEISLSALISRKSYGYYEAIDNILREENQGDLTYFIEYFMELLSRGIDERDRRMKKQQEETRQAEIEMAHVPLARSLHETPDTSPTEMMSAYSMQPEPSFQIESSTPYAAVSIPDEDIINMPMYYADNDNDPPIEVSPIEILQKYAENPDKIIGQLSIIILNRINEGIFQFCVAEVAKELQVIPRQLSKSIHYLKEYGIIAFEGKRNNNTFYNITVSEFLEMEQINQNLKVAEEQGTDPEMLQLIRELRDSSRSLKDRRLGTMLAMFLPQGYISLDDYRKYGNESKWSTDMALASLLGMVEKNNRTQCTILKELKSGPPNLSKKQRKFISDMYNTFGDSIFSIDMVIATLDYSGSHVSAYLHQFTLLRILECRKEEVNKYQFLVSPNDYPQLFEESA